MSHQPGRHAAADRQTYWVYYDFKKKKKREKNLSGLVVLEFL